MPISDLLAQITGEPSPTATTFQSLPKRKANDDFQKSEDKAQKVTTQPLKPPRPASRPQETAATIISRKPPPISKAPSSATTFKNGHPTPPPSSSTPKQPKKGSYAEIMARGQAAQKSLGPVGKIHHKKIEKLPSRREREEMRAQRSRKIQNGLQPNSKFQGAQNISHRRGKIGTKEDAKMSTEPVPEKKLKKAASATTGYAGTARPKPGSSTGVNRNNTSSRRPDRYDAGRSGSSRGPTYASEDEEDEEEIGDYESDVSSDMEAAAFEVDEEEELATRIARREDAEALEEENRLKREKENKKRKLMAMAKKAKPMSY